MIGEVESWPAMLESQGREPGGRASVFKTEPTTDPAKPPLSKFIKGEFPLLTHSPRAAAPCAPSPQQLRTQVGYQIQPIMLHLVSAAVFPCPHPPRPGLDFTYQTLPGLLEPIMYWGSSLCLYFYKRSPHISGVVGCFQRITKLLLQFHLFRPVQCL